MCFVRIWLWDIFSNVHLILLTFSHPLSYVLVDVSNRDIKVEKHSTLETNKLSKVKKYYSVKRLLLGKWMLEDLGNRGTNWKKKKPTKHCLLDFTCLLSWLKISKFCWGNSSVPKNFLVCKGEFWAVALKWRKVYCSGLARCHKAWKKFWHLEEENAVKQTHVFVFSLV